MATYLDALLTKSPFGADIDRPCFLLAMPQEIQDEICKYLIGDAIGNEDSTVWLIPGRHRGRATTALPNQVRMAYCNRHLRSVIARLLITNYTVGAPLSLDALHSFNGVQYLDLELQLRAVGDTWTNALSSMILIISGGKAMSTTAILQWARLSYDGPLAKEGMTITYDVEDCWDGGSDQCRAAHNQHIESILISVRDIALRLKSELTNDVKLQGMSLLDREIIAYLDAEGGYLPTTNSCLGCRFTKLHTEQTPNSQPDTE